MDRRGFLKLFGGVAAAAAVEQVIPLGRVWSFPKEIKLARPLGLVELVDAYIEPAAKQLALQIGDIVTIAAVNHREGWPPAKFIITHVEGDFIDIYPSGARVKAAAMKPVPIDIEKLSAVFAL